MSKILDFANDVSLDRFSRIRSSVSNAGIARTEIGSPVFYGMEVNLPLLTKSQYDEVELELLGLSDGVGFLTTTIPNSMAITTIKGKLDSNSDLKVKTAATGSSVTIDGFDISTTASNLQLLPGDYIKFPGTKAYQIKTTTAADPVDLTALTVTLNQPLIVNLSADDDVDVGQLVAFKFLLSGRPSVTLVPGPGYNYYQYGTFNFREVL